MKCYYEELGLARDANDADIKTAYRKLALRWHPDKNPNCLEEAKENFQLIQQAYEVLSDAHERAWYDNHREQILRGKNSDYEENCLDLFQYFTVCYKGYGNDAKGFYAVYREVFAKIVAEDVEFMDDEEEISLIPNFGDSQSSYDEVVGPFYAHWQAYCTKKTYTWLCKYDIQEIKDRRILREVEKDLKKTVQKAKKERNEEVRNLVSFVRKRDKRVQAHNRQLQERAALNREKQEKNRLEQIRKRQRDLEEMQKNNSHTFNENYEEQLKQLEQHYGSDSSDDEQQSDDENISSDLEEEDIMDDLYCVACNKAFTNENAYANHETSKKHRDNFERMKQEMLEEEDTYADTPAEDVIEEEHIEELEEQFMTARLDENFEETLLSDVESLDEIEIPKSTKKHKKDKKAKKTNKTNVISMPETSDAEEPVDDFIPQGKADDNLNNDSENWDSNHKKGAKKNKNKKPTKKSTDQTNSQKPTDVPTENMPPTPSSVNTESAEIPITNITHVCATCKSSFESKNKLFAHLKKNNHGIYLSKANTATVDTSHKKTKNNRK